MSRRIDNCGTTNATSPFVRVFEPLVVEDANSAVVVVRVIGSGTDSFLICALFVAPLLIPSAQVLVQVKILLYLRLLAAAHDVTSTG